MTLGTIVIDSRFNGPPNSANGGYACGRIAAFVDGAAEVTLHSPPPLDTELQVVAGDDGVKLFDDDRHIATAKPASLDMDPPPAPTFDEALLAESRTIPPEEHNLPNCFVCGPQRDHGDGLRIHVGPLDAGGRGWRGLLAATWVPCESLAGDDGRVPAEFVWAALDCPTGYAAGFSDTLKFMLLGRQSVEVVRPPTPGERCVVTARRTATDGRKLYSEGVLYGEDAAPIAWCRAVWIDVDQDVMMGNTR